jgi:hypothetical protein
MSSSRMASGALRSSLPVQGPHDGTSMTGRGQEAKAELKKAR